MAAPTRGSRRGPLQHLRVIDLSRVRSGPMATRQLADWGADVIRVESINDKTDGMAGRRNSTDYENTHRNKRSLALNLKTPEGLEILKSLVRDADVLVENFRPDVKDRLGIGYDTLAAINPRLVYASVSGFGQTGPYANRPGLDQVIQGMSGLMSVTGEPGGTPYRVGLPIGDLTAGLFTAIAIFTALEERHVTGRGRWVEVNLLQALVTLMDFQAARWLVDGEVAGATGNHHPVFIPTGTFATTDGHINVAASGGELWKKLARVIGRPDLIEDVRFVTDDRRNANRDALNAIIADRLATRSSADWIAAFNEAGVPCGEIYRMDQVFADPQVQHLGIAEPVTHDILGHDIHLVGRPFRIDGADLSPFRRTAMSGEHTDAVLRGLGYDDARIDALRQAGVIGGDPDRQGD
ncbi:CoA transferase [Rhodobacterales bacterium HKCCE2091]|nr:CoA transferase [Rhodobacterales bacterium HKCCE2091]